MEYYMSLPLEKSSPYGKRNKPPSVKSVEKQNQKKMDLEIKEFQIQEFSVIRQ